jgi:hypothetical protein
MPRLRVKSADGRLDPRRIPYRLAAHTRGRQATSAVRVRAGGAGARVILEARAFRASSASDALTSKS